MFCDIDGGCYDISVLSAVEKSCGIAGHPRPLALCLSQETNYRGEVSSMWAQTPDPDQDKCAQLASMSERGKYQVLSRCLRAAISEASWKDAVGTSPILRALLSPDGLLEQDDDLKKSHLAREAGHPTPFFQKPRRSALLLSGLRRCVTGKTLQFPGKPPN